MLSKLSNKAPRSDEGSVPRTSTQLSMGHVEKISPSSMKKSRFVFTEVQKRTLQAIFNETQRPSREMQSTIAQHLGLDAATVANFFMNARRRYQKMQRQAEEA